MSDYRWSVAAADDLADIWEYISQDNPLSADSWITELLKRCEVLARFPNAGKVARVGRKGTRMFPVGNYVVFYEVKDGVVTIVRVLQGNRDHRQAFREPND